jgi:hypothetical protein
MGDGMKFTVADLRTFYSSCNYLESLHAVCGENGIALDDSCPDIVYKFDLDALTSSNVGLKDLQGTLEFERVHFLKFVTVKYRNLSGAHEQEYPEREGPAHSEIREEIASIKDVSACENFLLGHLIEFWFLKHAPEALGAYLKEGRIPKARHYEKQLIGFFNASATS